MKKYFAIALMFSTITCCGQDKITKEKILSDLKGYSLTKAQEQDPVYWNPMPKDEPTFVNIYKVKYDRNNNPTVSIIFKAFENLTTKGKKKNISTVIAFVDLVYTGNKFRASPTITDVSTGEPYWRKEEYDATLSNILNFEIMQSFWESVQLAVENNDAVKIANMIQYPIYHPYNTELEIKNSKEFAMYYPTIFNSGIKSFIKNSVIGFPLKEDGDLDGEVAGHANVVSAETVFNDMGFTLRMQIAIIKGKVKIVALAWQN